MAQPPPVHEITDLPHGAVQALGSAGSLFAAHRANLIHCLGTTGFAEAEPRELSGVPEKELVLSALAGGQPVSICMPEPAADPMRLRALSEASCRALPTDQDIYYASFFAAPTEDKLYLLGPVLVRRNRNWLSGDVRSAQFLPRSLRGEDVALTPLLNGAELFKMEYLLIPYVLTHGEMPSFSITGLFNDRAQGKRGFQTLLLGASPTHIMLVHRGEDPRHFDFVRPVFFYGDAPDTELTLLQTELLEDAPESGLVELSTAVGTRLNAECLEAILLPGELPTGRRYRWTLSLVAEAVAAAHHPAPLSQEPLTTLTTLCARLLECEDVEIDSTIVQHWTLQLLPSEENVILHAFVGQDVASGFSATPGDVISCRGHLHASPDAILEEPPVEQETPRSEEVPAPPELSEVAACRILCNAVCTHEWSDFVAASLPGLSYVSRMNGTVLSDRTAFIRYMGERRQLWRKQRSWSCMSWDTGSILCEGKRRPCYMLSCAGQMVGASVLTLRDGKISAIETLPQSANDTFERDEECSTPPRIFHPFRGHLTAHSQEPDSLQLYAANYLRECMKLRTGYCPPNAGNPPSGAAHWVKLVRCQPGYCDLAFAHACHVFAIRAVEIPLHPANGGDPANIVAAMPDRDAFLSFAQQQGLIPCVFPAQRGFSPEPADTWNLRDARTLLPVKPEQLPSPDAAPPPSPWEILLGGIAEFQRHISAEGGSLIAYHDVPDFYPHLWFRNAAGALCWVIFRCTSNPAQPDSALSEAEALPLHLAPEASGYLVNATAFGDTACTKPPRRGEPAFLKTSILPLDRPANAAAASKKSTT